MSQDGFNHHVNEANEMGCDAVMIADAYLRAAQAGTRSETVDHAQEAAVLRILVRAAARCPRMIAIAPENDTAIQDAYADAGFTLVKMNGNRPSELPRLIDGEIASLRRDHPKRLIMVTGDSSFARLAQQAHHANADVAVWWAGAPAAELNQPEYDVRRLADVAPCAALRVGVAAIYIDYENIHICLERLGLRPTPQAIIRAIRSEACNLGKIAEVHAYADWQQVAQGAEGDIQRELVKLNVKTHYQINKHGKNLADMEIVNDIRTRSEHTDRAADAPSAVVLVTGDRDFVTIVNQLQGEGKRVRVLTLRAACSSDLAQAAEDIRYLDTHFRPGSVSGADAGGSSSGDRLFAFIMGVAAYLQQQQWSWIAPEKLAASPAAAAGGPPVIQAAIAAQLLAPGPAHAPHSLRLNRTHPDACFATWLCRRLHECLNERHMPYVDTSYLVRGILSDEGLQAQKIGRTWEEACRALERAAATGWIVKQSRPHPHTPSRQIDTWRLAPICAAC